ncbi:replicative DNA helicase [uncultured Brevibacillus sp.]|uniref:replicative DNA helicase n=1 Tax=uncultured Brevibacillus sp. TaxID=169970 RepID=UPI002596C756|nr:replicative DNA helicase [uncultured Brevibacillus sp.]
MQIDRLTGMVEGYKERIQRLALFDPLHKLEAKREKDRQDRPIDFFGLGFLALLFFFENMLLRNKKAGAKELAEYLQQMNQGEIDLDKEGFEKLARTIVDVFRPPSGKRNARTFYNWETRQMDSVEYSILKAERGDLSSNKQYYSLDEHGLELVFATKEFFREFHLSINQLLLRKQLEKGEFAGALRQISEMSVDVETLKERILRIKHEVQRSMVSEETYLRFKQVIEDIHTRLAREHEEFTELQTFVDETKERLLYERKDGKEQRAYEYILRIDRELGEVHFAHTQLLKDSIALKTTALQAAQESLYHVALQSFNFDQEIVSRLVSTPLPLFATRTLLEPFLGLEQMASWSPLAVFEKQRIGVAQEEEEQEEFEEVTNEQEQAHSMIQQANFGTLMQRIFSLLGEKNEITLEEVAVQLWENGDDAWLKHRSFYDFWLLLHQRTPLQKSEGEEENHLLKEVLSQLAPSEIIRVTELPGRLRLTERYEIQNMIFTRERRYDV